MESSNGTEIIIKGIIGGLINVETRENEEKAAGKNKEAANEKAAGRNKEAENMEIIKRGLTLWVGKGGQMKRTLLLVMATSVLSGCWFRAGPVGGGIGDGGGGNGGASSEHRGHEGHGDRDR